MQNGNLTARNEKNSACDFFSHSRNFDAISCKKMREYREIAPENDPCSVMSKFDIYVEVSILINYNSTTTIIPCMTHLPDLLTWQVC